VKKTGIITTQYAPNYGALLQTFAMQKYLDKIYGYEKAEVINYYPPHAKEFWKIFHWEKSFKRLALNAYLLLHPGLIKMKKKNTKNFKNFINEYIRCSKEYLTFEELKSLKEEYDTLICGSDQIWNITRHDDPAWFLYFSKEWDSCRKIAYAPSVADKIPAGHEKNLTAYLDNLDYISVREDVDVEQLQPFTNKEVKHVCDPVFLLSPSEWESYLPESKVKEPYIFCYFISTGDLAPKVVDRMRELTGLKVLHFNVNIRDKFNSEYNIRGGTPFEFVNYIKNATYVCTNSFHCTAFSVLFKKDFLVVKKSSANSRMESLVRSSGLKNRFVDEKTVIEDITMEKLKTDYSGYKMEEFITYSKAYIEGAIKSE